MTRTIHGRVRALRRVCVVGDVPADDGAATVSTVSEVPDTPEAVKEWALAQAAGTYRVTIGAVQGCSCGLDDVCVHVLFVMLKIMRLADDNALVWQRSLVDSELDRLLHDRELNRLRQIVGDAEAKKKCVVGDGYTHVSARAAAVARRRRRVCVCVCRRSNCCEGVTTAVARCHCGCADPRRRLRWRRARCPASRSLRARRAPSA